MRILADNPVSNNNEVAVVMHPEDKPIEDQAVVVVDDMADDGRNIDKLSWIKETYSENEMHNAIDMIK